MQIERIVAEKFSLDGAAQVARQWLSEHPTIYKTVIVAMHLFRATMAYAFMNMLPLSFLASCAICVGTGMAYRILIEKACQFKFAIPSAFGAATWMIGKRVTFIPFGLYLASIVTFSSDEVDHALGKTV